MKWAYEYLKKDSTHVIGTIFIQLCKYINPYMEMFRLVYPAYSYETRTNSLLIYYLYKTSLQIFLRTVPCIIYYCLSLPSRLNQISWSPLKILGLRTYED